MYKFLKKSYNQLQYSEDIVKTSSVLRKLKNKILNLFDSERREKVKDLILKSEEIKPLLPEILSLIKNLEESIEDLDLKDYDNTVKELKSKTSYLLSKLDSIKDITEESIELKKETEKPEEKPKEEIKEKVKEKVEEKPEEERPKRTRVMSKDPEFKRIRSIYSGVTTLSDLGATSNSILENQIGPKGIYASWGFINFAKKSINPGDLIELQKGIKDNDIRTLFYDNIPKFRIISVLPREIAYKDDPAKGWKYGDKKPGLLEIKVQTPLLPLPYPANNWKLSVVFVLVDMYGEPKKARNYRIYRQLVVTAKDDVTGKSEQWNESEAAKNEQTLTKLEIK